ncbi:hypothetical protein TREPR_0048 [Treponema primitia ZAS-2]|uniref:Uncharacterized protein n=1 Tax=Treponema primitia (strain ATCC BAA-887 / DSM 12427 / ZAS-2) TaxID=545694 RepID=F5YNE0_TREPZ|nr:hypothetical protein TREPR_0048 [Treponema primitia ZAS-2]
MRIAATPIKLKENKNPNLFTEDPLYVFLYYIIQNLGNLESPSNYIE